MKKYDVIVIGGGQSGMAVGYYLRRTGLSYVLLDDNQEGGGSWIYTWKSLRLFSPAQWSSLPGEGNSGAQILAEVSKVADTLWITMKEPRFLPDHIDGRYLFDAATQMYEAQKAGKEFKPPSLGDIVMVEPVKDARERNVLSSVRPFDHFTEDSLVWSDGRMEKIDAVIFCTGFKPGLQHLAGLGIVNYDGKVDTIGTKSKLMEGLWLVGYGNWTGFASATLIGVGRSARRTVDEIQEYIAKEVSTK